VIEAMSTPPPPAPDVLVQVGMAPFVATVSEPTPLPDGNVGLLVNCGLHASRVVGKGGSKIAELMTQTGANMRVTRNSGLCEITGTPDAVEHAKRSVLEIVEDGDTRDLRAAVSQALHIRDGARGGLVVAEPTVGRVGVDVEWTDSETLPSKENPFVPPRVTNKFVVPLSLR